MIIFNILLRAVARSQENRFYMWSQNSFLSTKERELKRDDEEGDRADCCPHPKFKAPRQRRRQEGKVGEGDECRGGGGKHPCDCSHEEMEENGREVAKRWSLRLGGWSTSKPEAASSSPSLFWQAWWETCGWTAWEPAATSSGSAVHAALKSWLPFGWLGFKSYRLVFSVEVPCCYQFVHAINFGHMNIMWQTNRRIEMTAKSRTTFDSKTYRDLDYNFVFVSIGGPSSLWALMVYFWNIYILLWSRITAAWLSWGRIVVLTIDGRLWC